MQLKTYTGLWNVENRLYKFYDINLPFPIPVKQLGIGIAAFVPWLFLMNLLGISFHPPFGEIIWIAPPALLTWWSNKPVAEGKKLFDFLSSQFIYFFGPKTYSALAPMKIDTPPVIVKGHLWRRVYTK